MPRIDVILAVYNGEETVGDSISSVLNQTYTDFRLIIVNDGSTDGTLSVISKFCDKRIFLVNLPNNSGVANARNRGLAEVTSEFIAFLDADDLWEPHKLELQITELLRCDLMLVCSNALIGRHRQDTKLRSLYGWVSLSRLHFENAIIFSSALVRKELIAQVRFLNVPHEDYLFWFHCFSNNKSARGLCIDRPLVFYRTGCDGNSGGKYQSIIKYFQVQYLMGFNPCRIAFHFLKRMLSVANRKFSGKKKCLIA